MYNCLMIPKHAKKVFQGELYSVWQWEQELYDGSTATFETISRTDYAAVVGVLPNKEILLVRDEQPHRDVVLTPAGGRVEEGESPEEGAKREFLEETGYEVGSVVPLLSYAPSGKSDFTVHIFVAKDLEKVGEQMLEAGEKVELVTFSLDEFIALGHNPELRDSMLRIMLLEAVINKSKKEKLYKILYG